MSPDLHLLSMPFYALLSRLPLSVLYGLSYCLYLCLYYIARYRRAVVHNNISLVFPEKDLSETSALSKKFYRQLCDVAVEIIKARVLRPDDYQKRITLINSELMETYRQQEQPVIILTIHACNWEWMLHATRLQLDIPIDAVYKSLHNKTANDLIYDIRSRFGIRPLNVQESTKDVIRRRQEFRLLTLVADQSPIPREKSYWTTFLGQPSAFYQGAEKIAMLTKYPIVFAAMKRTRRGHYTVEYQPLAEPPYVKDSHDILDAYIAAAEKVIREQPESWLWSNRRWKRQAPETLTKKTENELS